MESDELSSTVILSLDQALASTGWSAIKLNPLVLIDYGTITTRPQQENLDRLIQIESSIENLVAMYKPTTVYLEQTYRPRDSPGAWEVLLIVETIIKLRLYKDNIPFVSISSNPIVKNSWRTLLKLKDKKESKNYFKTKDTHQGDAIAIGLAGAIINQQLDIKQVHDLYGKPKDSHQL